MSYPLPNEFRPRSGFGKVAAPFIAMIVLFFLIMLLLGSIAGGLVVGILAGVVGALALVGVLFAKFKRMQDSTVLRFSAYGVELADSAKGFHVRLPWPGITRLGQVDTQMANPRSVGADGGVSVSVGAHRSEGLIGWGERQVPPNAPAWLRASLAAAPVNPVDGRVEVAITLSGIDPAWRQGVIGRWVGHYRPDLLFGQPAGPHR